MPQELRHVIIEFSPRDYVAKRMDALAVSNFIHELRVFVALRLGTPVENVEASWVLVENSQNKPAIDIKIIYTVIPGLLEPTKEVRDSLADDLSDHVITMNWPEEVTEVAVLVLPQHDVSYALAVLSCK
jgi:hypothetical protein